MDTLKSRQPPPTIIEDKSSRSIHIKKYKVCGHLGKGGFANVYRVESNDSKKLYACKVINKSKLVHHEHKRKLISEIKLHSSLQHENIVKFERHFEDKTNVYILLEVCSNKSLMELSIKRKKLTEHEVKFFLNQIVNALKFLHKRFIIHRDLKLGNILLDKNLNIKLCDFGLAAQLAHDADRKNTICGTPNYTAPEILNQRKTGLGHSYEVDIWSIGVIIFTLLVGKPPFETKNIKETYRRIKKIKYEFPINCDKYISIYAKDLISKIFTKEPTQRPNLIQIENHLFFKKLQIPQKLPMIILKRKPTEKELFPQKLNIKNNNNNIKNGNRPLLISKTFNSNIYSNHNINMNMNDDIKYDNTFDSFISIIKYVDYTKKYGFGYILSNGSTGIYFNDSTKILLLKNKSNVIYINSQQIKQKYTINNYPNCLKKKVTLLKHFTDYLWKNNNNENNNDNDNNLNVQLNNLKISQSISDNNNNNNINIYLKTFVSDQYCLLFKLSNNMVQVNFTDNSQLLIIDKLVSYKNKIGEKNTFKLYQISNSNKKDLKKRLKYTQQLLQKIANKKNEK